MKSFKEIAKMIENHIDKAMVDPMVALKDGEEVNIDAWNGAMCRACEEDAYTDEEIKEKYKKMLDYSETLLDLSVGVHDKFGHPKSMKVLHTFRTMKENYSMNHNDEREEALVATRTPIVIHNCEINVSDSANTSCIQAELCKN